MASPLFLAAVGRQTQNLSIFDPASPPADSIRNLAILVLAITGAIFVVVEGILIYCILRFRRRAGSTSEPPQVYGSKSIEIAWTAAPCLIVAILVLVTARTLWEVNVDHPKPQKGDNALHVTVIGHQFWWEYRYDNYNDDEEHPLGFTTANELVIPAGRKVYLTLQSADVCHSYWVPRLAGKVDLIPGRTNYMWFETKETGLFVGQCAEFCGSQHANMLLRVIVKSPEDFETWLKHEQADQPTPVSTELLDARNKFMQQSCVTCHRIRGTSAQDRGAPDLTHVMSRQTLAAGMLENDAAGENLTKWVDDPQKIKPGCLMPAFGLTGRDRKLVLDYLKSLK